MLITIGPADYHARAERNLREWERLVERIKYDPKTHVVAADTEELVKIGVRPSFVSYALRSGWLRAVLA